MMMSVCRSGAFCTTVHEDRRLHAAIGDGRLDRVVALLAGGASVNCYVDGMTPTARAISSRQPTVALEVLRHRPDVHQGWRVFLRPVTTTTTPASVSSPRAPPGHVWGRPAVHACWTAPDIHTPLLLLAVQQGYADIAAALLEMGADVNTIDDVSNECALHLAAKNGNANIVRSLLDHEPNVNRIDVNSNAPLHLAVATDNHEVTKLLLQADAVVNIPGPGYLLPLHIACDNDSPRMVALLLDAGAMVNVTDAYNATPLHYSAVHGTEEITRLLLSTHICCNTTDDAGATPLSRACEGGNEEVVKVLLQSGKVSPNDEAGRGNGKRLALQVAAAAGHVDVLRILVDNGAFINRQDFGRRQTALHAAAAQKQDASVRFLLGAGIDANMADSEGRTALHVACNQGDSAVDVVGTLLQNGVDPNQQEKGSKESGLHAAARTGSEALVELILQEDSIKVDVMDARGHTPLEVAVQNNRCNIARTLIAKGSRLTSELANTSSALHTAIRNGQQNLALDLTRHGSRVNHVDESGLTPLALIMQQVGDLESIYRNEDTLKLYMTLLFAGTDVGRSDARDSTLGRLSSREDPRLMIFVASTAPTTLEWACVYRVRAHLSSLTGGASILMLPSHLPLPVLLQKKLALEYHCLF